MAQHNHKDDLQDDLEALAEAFEAEEREDRRARPKPPSAAPTQPRTRDSR